MFQSTRPRGARHKGILNIRGVLCFNPRARVGRDISIASTSWYGICFNPRARVGRDPRYDGRKARRGGFNPRARVGRDVLCPFLRRSNHPVSIHAPAWGATFTFQPNSLASDSFNPRARVGRDSVEVSMEYTEKVSIHAPAWGATGGRNSPRHWQRCFNPRARVGRDAFAKTLADGRDVFQSTRPRGARPPPAPEVLAPVLFQSTRPRGARQPLSQASSIRQDCFNPRARVGRDTAIVCP